MNYILKNVEKESLMETILNNRGIEDVHRILNPDNSSDTDTSKITNVKEGIHLIKQYIDGGNILILVDSDVDGMTSGVIMYKYLKNINKYSKISYYFHNGKYHGLTDEFMDFLTKNKFDLIIVPDAGTNDLKNIEKIKVLYNTDILIIDHHPVIDEISEYAVTINNQMCEYTNSNLTGAGLAYLFCKEMNKEYNIEGFDELLDLASVGQVGDCSDLRENEVRNMCMTSLSNIKNNFMSTVYTESGKDIHDLSIQDLSFRGIIPMINAVMRIGTTDDKEIAFRALADIEPTQTWIVTKRKLNKTTRKFGMVDYEMNLYQYANEICLKIKNRQNEISNSTIEVLEKQFDSNSDIQIYIIDFDDKAFEKRNSYEIKGVIGLIANKLADKFGKPTIVCWRDRGGHLIGSLRGNEKVLKDFKQWCLDTSLFELVAGHSNAAGVVLKENMVDSVKEKMKTVETNGVCHEVDYIFKNVSSDVMYEVEKYKKLWNNGIETPLFAYENIKIPTSSIKWSKNTMRIYYNGVTLVKFKTPEEKVNEIINSGDYVTMSFVGTAEINHWGMKCYPQVMIKDFEYSKFNNEYTDYGIFL